MLYNGLSGVKGLSMPVMLDEPYRLTKGRGLFIRVVTRAWTIAIFLLLTTHITSCYFRALYYALPWRRKGLEKTTFEEWAEQTVPTGTLARWTRMDVAWRHYTHAILLPLFSAVCTAPEEDVYRHPVEEFLGWFALVPPLPIMLKGPTDYIWLTFEIHQQFLSPVWGP